MIYNIDTRCFLRAIVQYRDVGRDPAMYGSPVDARSRDVFAQFLFSYKLNPQTVLFLGYSDNSAAVCLRVPRPRGPDVLPEDRLCLDDVSGVLLPLPMGGGKGL